MSKLLSAFPYFGSKRQAAATAWEAFGDPPNYCEPFGGSAAVLLARPHIGKVETVNDMNCWIINFMRGVAADPEQVAHYAAWPVSEIDMQARHDFLNAHVSLVEQCREDPEFYDAKFAGWWVWGQSIWIGSGWCDHGHRNAGTRQRPQLSTGNGINRRIKLPRLQGASDGTTKRPDVGVGIFRKDLHQSQRKRPDLQGGGAKGKPRAGAGIFRAQLNRLPHLAGPNNGGKQRGDGSGVGYGRGIFASGRREDLLGYFQQLADRFQRVRFTCGDFARILTPAVTVSHGLTAVFLDAPYDAQRTRGIYAHDDAEDASRRAREWALEHGDDPKLRIALCGYELEHAPYMPPSWRKHSWKANGGYGNRSGRKNENSKQERIWFSPYCLGGQKVCGPLFERASQQEAARRGGSWPGATTGEIIVP